jgi:Ca-activated chloride channel homolog
LKNFKYIIFVILFFLITDTSFSQTVDDYFHGASNFYVNGKNQRAKNEIHEGLKISPSDARLNSLQELIKEEEKQQEQQQNSQEEQEGDEKEDQEGQNEDQNEEQQQEEQQQAQQVEEEKDQMSKEDAERILEALKNDEQDNQKLRKPKKGGRRSVAKDW